MKNRPTLSLYEVPVGSRVRIRQLHTESDVNVRLRELGFCEDRVVRCIMKGHGNIVCEVSNTRIGLNRRVARGITVSPFE